MKSSHVYRLCLCCFTCSVGVSLLCYLFCRCRISLVSLLLYLFCRLCLCCVTCSVGVGYRLCLCCFTCSVGVGYRLFLCCFTCSVGVVFIVLMLLLRRCLILYCLSLWSRFLSLSPIRLSLWSFPSITFVRSDYE